MVISKKYFSLLALGASVVGLNACSVNHPNGMPSGYTYHHQAYKSPSTPPSLKVTPDQRRYMDAAQAEQFRDAVYDILKRLTARAGMPPKPIYVLQPDPMTTFYANIDNDLREGMRHIGYAISDLPVGAYVFTYDARILEKPRGYISQGEPNVELILKVFDSVSQNARMLSQESGWYYIQGAETLRIKPATYKTLPSRRKIQQQAEGFVPLEASRTATQMTTRPVHDPQPDTFTATPFSASKAAVRPAPPPPLPVGGAVMPPADYTPNYSGPEQAMVIDSNGVSYSGSTPQVNREPLMPRAGISREIEY